MRMKGGDIKRLSFSVFQVLFCFLLLQRQTSKASELPNTLLGAWRCYLRSEIFWRASRVTQTAQTQHNTNNPLNKDCGAQCVLQCDKTLDSIEKDLKASDCGFWGKHACILISTRANYFTRVLILPTWETYVRGGFPIHWSSLDSPRWKCTTRRN